MSVVSSSERATNVASDISDLIFAVISLAIASIRSFCIAGDVPLNIVAVFKWLAITGS